jgi:hypothetical protein
MYGVISPGPDNFTSPSMCQYVVCACESRCSVGCYRDVYFFALLFKN